MAAKDTVTSKELSDGSVFVESARGTAHLSHLKPGVIAYHCTGFLSEDFTAPMVAFAQAEMARRGNLVMLVDGWELVSIDTGFREKWTEWFKLNKQTFRMHLLVRTKIMDMAASIANLFTGVSVIKTYSNVGLWERACAEHVPGFRRSERVAASR